MQSLFSLAPSDIHTTTLQRNIKFQGIRQKRQFLWRANGNTLFPPGLPRNEFTGRFADRKLIGYKANQMLIGFTINRRGLNSQLQTFSVQPRPLIFAGLGLNMEIQRQDPMFPVIPVQPIKLAN